MDKKRIISFVAASFAIVFVVNGQVSFVGDAAHKVIAEKPTSSTGLDMVYVVYNTQNVKMQYVATNADATVTWYKYGSLGGAYAEPLTDVKRNGVVTELNNVLPNTGYIIEEGTKRTYLWVVNYSDYYLHLQSIAANNEADCGSCVLNVEGKGNDIVYYTINGGLKKLNRQIELSYNTLEWSQEALGWVQVQQVEKLSEFKPVISLQAPYCDTRFEISGDAFLKQWGEAQSVSSGECEAKAVAVNAVVTQEQKDADNQKGGSEGSENLGGSAPATINFVGYPTDAADRCEWQMSYTPDFENVEVQYTERGLQKIFEEAGTTYWRFVGANSASGCQSESDVYTVSIGESSLQCPNAFSPGTTEGVNDEWKVSYKSIVKFKCWIFNSWGIQLCELSDPSQGWDGKYKGKLVSPGVYYYVIEAEGSEGKKYKLKGDINIVGLKSSKHTTDDKGE